MNALMQAIGQQRPGAELRCEPLVQREGVLAWALSATPGR
jgi:hypothetical protein